MTVHYFAYGSNMSRARMVTRVPEAEDLGKGVVEDWALVCNKSGTDGSAKANLVARPGAQLWGVVYRLPVRRLAELDVIEGGYERFPVPVWIGEARLRCQVYASDRLTDDLRAFDWYRDLMVAGAEEHDLPEAHVEQLRSLPVRPAPAVAAPDRPAYTADPSDSGAKNR